MTSVFLKAAAALADAAKTAATAAADAAAANVDRLPKGLELENNEVVKVFYKVAQQMILQDLDPAEAAKRLQEQVSRIKD